MSNLTKRMRWFAEGTLVGIAGDALLMEGADRIEKLKAERDVLQTKVIALENTLRDAEFHILQYKYAEGCSCCRDIDAHEHHEKELALLFGWPRYDDDSGWDWRSRRKQMLKESSNE